MPPPLPLKAFPWYDVVVLFLLIGLNGLFAMAELAIVSSRKPRLKAMAKKGRSGAQTALDLAADPGRFLSTVQIGITGMGLHLIACMADYFAMSKRRQGGTEIRMRFGSNARQSSGDIHLVAA